MNPSSHGHAETPAAPAATAPSPAAGSGERLDQLVARLPQLRELPLADHPEFYETVHTELQAALADIQGS